MFGIYFPLSLAGMFFGELANKASTFALAERRAKRTIAKIVTAFSTIVGGSFSEFVRTHRTLVLQQGSMEGPAPSVGIGGPGFFFSHSKPLINLSPDAARKRWQPIWFISFRLSFVWLLIEGLALPGPVELEICLAPL
ncbi:MAG: hypothetical protein IPH75_16415 [bacterium]|nr:hypothetical protein [bacterium]